MGLSIVEERKKIMDFSPPIFSDGYSWLSKKEPPQVFWLIYIQPFKSWIWVALAVVFCVSWLTFFLIELMSPKQQHSRTAEAAQKIPFADGYKFGDVFLVVVNTMTLGKIPVNPRMLSARLFMVIFWFFSLVMMLTYASYLTAYMYESTSSESPKGTFDNILLNSKIYRWFWTDGEAVFPRMLSYENGSTPHGLAATAQEKWRSEMLVPRERIIDVILSDANYIYIGENSFTSYIHSKVSE